MSEKKGPKVVSFKAGELIIKEGELGRSMYIIKAGDVRVFKTFLGRKVAIGHLSAGEIFGELGFFDGKKRIASIDALSDISAICIDGQKVEKDIKELPNWLASIFKTVVERLRSTDEKLAVLQNKIEFENTSKKTEGMSKEIFQEILRYNKLFQLILKVSGKEDESQETESFTKELNELVGGSFIKVEHLLLTYEKYGLIEKEDETKIKIKNKEITNFNSYLIEHQKKFSNWVFSAEALSIMKIILEEMSSEEIEKHANESVFDFIEMVKIKKQPFFSDFIKELKGYKLIKDNLADLEMNLSTFQEHFNYQNILRSCGQ